MKGREKEVNWLGTWEPKEQHNGESLGVSFAFSIPDLKLKKPATQQMQTIKAPPKDCSLCKEAEKGWPREMKIFRQ